MRQCWGFERFERRYILHFEQIDEDADDAKNEADNGGLNIVAFVNYYYRGHVVGRYPRSEAAFERAGTDGRNGRW